MDGSGRRRREPIAELPMKLEIGAYYNAIRPTVSQEPWQLQTKLTFVFSEKQTRPVLKK